MANGFGSLFIGASGLQNAQSALNTTANNLSNVGTTGYVRQQVRFADKNYNKLKDGCRNVNMQQYGLGVGIGDVVHARDIFLDKRYRQNYGCKEFYSVRAESADYVTDLLQEMHGEQFKNSISDFWQACQELSTENEVTVYQNLVVEKAELLISRAKTLYSDFQKYQSNLNEQIEDDVDRVNEIGQRIYELNLDIQKIEAGGVETAMTLRDERDNLLDELGAYGMIEIKEDQTGFVYVEFERTRFIDENRAYEIALKRDKLTGFETPYWTHLSDVEKELYVPVFHLDNAAQTDIRFDTGKIKSKMIVRGDKYGTAADMENAQAYDKIAGSTVTVVEAQMDKLMSSIMMAINDVFCPNVETTEDIALADGTNLPAGTLILDTENCARGSDGKLPPRELFTRADVDRYREVTGDDGKTYYVYNAPKDGDIDSQYSITNVSVNEDLKKQVSLTPAFLENGTVAFKLAKKFSDAWNETGMKLNPYDEKPCNFEDYYNRVIVELGLEGNIYKSATDTMEGAMYSIDNKRQQIMGVSSDEELTQMIKYQSAYNAASRFMTVISEMTELIVTGLGR